MELVLDSKRGALWVVETPGMGPHKVMWRLDLATAAWERIDGSGSPSARSGPSVVHDPKRGVLWMVGGSYEQPTRMGTINDVWRFDLASRTWQQVATSGAPKGMLEHRVFMDAGGDVLWVFGGAESIAPSGIGIHKTLGTWKLDLTTMTWHKLNGGPQGSSNGAAAYDPSTATLWWIGHNYDDDGRSNGRVVWRLGSDGRWRKDNVTGEPQEFVHAVAWARVIGNELWIVDGALFHVEGGKRWRRPGGLPQSCSPSPAAFDPRTQTIWIVGCSPTRTFAYSIATGKMETLPGPRDSGAVVLDQDRNALWLIGRSTWSLDLQKRRWREYVALPPGMSCAAGAMPRFDPEANARGCAIETPQGLVWDGPYESYRARMLEQKGQHTGGKKTGRWLYWTQKYRFSEVFYKDDRPHGRATTWHVPPGGSSWIKLDEREYGDGRDTGAPPCFRETVPGFHCGGSPPDPGYKPHPITICHQCRDNRDCTKANGGRCTLFGSAVPCVLPMRLCRYPSNACYEASCPTGQTCLHDGQGQARCAFPPGPVP
jgi:hypothetical protein